MITIYLLTNTNNNKVYVGQTVNIRNRMYSHKNKKLQLPLSNSIQKNGWDCFKLTELVSCEDQITANCLEKFWIKLFNSADKEFGYNASDGGKCENRGWHHSKDSKVKISNALKGNLKLSHKNEDHPMAKITFEIAEQIRKEYKPESYKNAHDGVSCDFLAKKYNVGKSTILGIINNKRWI